LKNVCINIPLLQAIRDVPIYSKMVRELCLKKPGRKQKDPPTIHVIGQLSNYISDYSLPPKFANPGNPVVTICINEIPIGNTLVDLGAAINVMSMTTMQRLQLYNLLRPTPTILELADRSTVKPVGALDDITVTVASWEYPVDFLVLQTKHPMGEHPVILGRPWLATANAFIGCREGILTISNGTSLQNLIIYPPAQPVLENMLWLENPYGDEDVEQPLLSISQTRGLEHQTEDDILDQFISATTSIEFPQSFSDLDHVFTESFQEQYYPSATSSSVVLFIDEKVGA